MKRLCFLFVLSLSGISTVSGDECISIRDGSERLTCFDAVIACTKIMKTEARLACYDKAYTESAIVSAPVEPMNVETDADESPVIVEHKVPVKIVEKQEEPAPLKQDAEESFGKKESSKDPAKYIQSTIVDVMRNSHKIDYLRLENGQIWRENDDYRVRYKVGQSVRIEKGILGSYNLKIKGVKKLMKVKRIN
ncbi:MAG: hypothetical protein VB957_18870 [Pseudomonadales bacterium]|jgi:hypothetical protein